jgi:hypothetical protein
MGASTYNDEARIRTEKHTGGKYLSKRMRVGIIGVGSIAQAHIHSFRAVDDIEIVAL